MKFDFSPRRIFFFSFLVFFFSLLPFSLSFSHASFSQKVFAAEVLESVPSLIQGSEILAWHPQKDDRMEVDLTQNRGYLIHPNGERFSFDVATGQKRYVYYIGLYYFAATPVRLWEVASMDIKDDRVTFGKTGRFFRLNFQGGRTAYGIHGYNPEQWMFREGERYRSYGCIIVQEEVLDIIAATYILNEGHLRVETLETVHFFENLADSSLDDKDRLSNTLLEFFVESKKEFLDALPGSLSVVI